jgi:hypothetical protein
MRRNSRFTGRLRRSGRALRRVALGLAIAGIAGCADLGPLPGVDQVSVRVEPEVPVITRTQSGGYLLKLSLSVTNNTGDALFFDTLCDLDWEREKVTGWGLIEPAHVCPPAEKLLKRIDPRMSLPISFVRGGGSAFNVPEFARPGTYRLHIRLYRDQYGHNPLPDEYGYTTSFTIQTNQ